MKIHAFRLRTGDDLKKELSRYAEEHDLRSGVILTCVGSLSQAVLRMAGARPDKEDVRTSREDFEIVSLVGTISKSGMHLHASLASTSGQCIGGHLKEGCIINTTAEIVIVEDENLDFTREPDPETGFSELVIKKRDII